MAGKITMTAAEVEAHTRTVDRRCRGPRITSVADALDAYADHRAATGREPMDDEYVAKLGALPDVGALVADMLNCGADDDARFIDNLREPCGADFNAIILDTPHDGKEHAYECPSCGLVGVFRAAKITVVDDPKS